MNAEKVIDLSARRGARAAECHKAGEASFAERDALIKQEYDSLPLRGTKQRAGFREWCERWGLPWSTATDAVRRSENPDGEAKRKRAERAARKSGRPDISPSAAPKSGELNEASMGFRAAFQRFAKERDPKRSAQWATTGLQHFKFVLERSNVPEIMGMTAEQIIKHIRGEMK